MSTQTAADDTVTAASSSSWNAVFALSLGAFVLVASEFMPVSLLTPIASDLSISEGQAGQSIAVSGAFAVMTSLLMSSVIGRLDRKVLLILLTGVMIASCTISAIATNFATFMIARAFIGLAIGGFWSMSAATAMRLVPADQVPRALALLNGGNALATIVAPPLGSYLGGLIGWRGAFLCLVPVAVVAFVWQIVSLPTMKIHTRPDPAGAFKLLRRPTVVVGMAAVSLFFMGQFALFTYVRPFLETVAQVDVSSLSMVLLIMGVAGFVGTVLIGYFLKEHLYRTLVVIPVLMSGIAFCLIAFAGHLILTASLLGFWGFLATAAPVGWWTWLSRTVPRDAEAGGGLMVAVVQLAITAGATVGGLLFDAQGYEATFTTSAMVLLLGAVVTGAAAFIAKQVV